MRERQSQFAATLPNRRAELGRQTQVPARALSPVPSSGPDLRTTLLMIMIIPTYYTLLYYYIIYIYVYTCTYIILELGSGEKETHARRTQNTEAHQGQVPDGG